MKRLLTLLLAVVMLLGTFTGCGNTAEEKTEPPQAVAAEPSEQNNQEASDGTIKLPLTDEPITLTVFAGMDSNLTGIINDYNENGFFKELEKRTGVHLEFIIPAAGTEKEQYNLMIASGEMADIITHNGYNYPEGLDAAVDDGYYLDLTPYLDTCLPDYNRVRTSDPLMEKSTVTDKGRVVGLHILYTEKQGPWMGMQIRKDWLDELGLEVPTTYDELEEVLKQFKEKKGAYAPLSIGSKGTMETSHALSAGYGVMETFQQVDGVVQYGPIEEGWKEYLTMLNRWYQEGLIDPDFMTNGGWQVDTAMVLNGDTGVWNAMYTMISQYEANGDIEVVPMTSPVKEKGDALHIRREDGFVGNAVTISADCKYPEIAMKLWNYLYSEEGALLANYGVEGDTFNFVDGSPREMVATMNRDAVIFACANPTPEIFPEEAKAGGARIVATGRSDYPNQINNVLAFPGVFRGAFDVRASEINEEMKIAAASALANLVAKEELSEDNIIPAAFDPRVGPAVAKAVAEAARNSGVARR